MDKEIYQILEDIGLDEKPAAVYFATLQLGGDTASNIAKKAGIERVNTYYILDQLCKKKLVYTAEKDKITIYIANSPKKLEQIAAERLARVKKFLPELLSFENTYKAKPKIKYYEGIEGIKECFEEIINIPEGSEILSFFASFNHNKYIDEYMKELTRLRVLQNIKQRSIVEYNEESAKQKKFDHGSLRETRLINKASFPFNNQIIIFKNCILIASFDDMVGIIIENDQIAASQRSIFELAWLGSKQVEVIE